MGTKVGPDQLGPPVQVGSTRINSDRLRSSRITKKTHKIKWNIETFYPFEAKILVKNGSYQERLATFLLVMLCSQAAILYSKYQFSQVPQAQNTWCMPQLVYIDNYMGKFLPQVCRKLVSCAIFKAIVMPFSRLRVVGFCSWDPLLVELKICYAN